MTEREEYGESLFGSSPPCRPVIAEASDLFRAVMDDLVHDEDVRISRAEMERYKTAKLAGNDEEDRHSERCKTCGKVCKLCSCTSNSSLSSLDKSNHVHWVDEVWDRPLCQEQEYNSDRTRTPSPVTQRDDSPVARRKSVKPILKHKPTCIIVVSDR